MKKMASVGWVSTLRRILLTIVTVIVLFGSLPVSQARAASAIGWIGTSVTCLPGKISINPGFIGPYDGQWVLF